MCLIIIHDSPHWAVLCLMSENENVLGFTTTARTALFCFWWECTMSHHHTYYVTSSFHQEFCLWWECTWLLFVTAFTVLPHSYTIHGHLLSKVLKRKFTQIYYFSQPALRCLIRILSMDIYSLKYQKTFFTQIYYFSQPALCCLIRILSMDIYSLKS